jgi:hypothetical protein
MRARGGGAIVNTASISGLGGDYGFSAYNAAKGALVNYTRTLAVDHGKDGIRVNALCPGYIDTPLAAPLKAIPGLVDAWLPGIPLGRAGTSEEMAKVVAFLASDDAAYVTGSHHGGRRRDDRAHRPAELHRARRRGAGGRRAYIGAMTTATALRPFDIDFVGAQGDGVRAGGPADAPVYVPFTLPGERVTAELDGDRGGLAQVLEASPDRVVPPCPHFGVCGGCAVQHWAHPPYLAWKVEQLRAALARERIETTFAPPFAAPPGSRRRLALHVRPGENGAARLGYKERGSWTLVDVAVCPISDPRLVAAFPALRRLGAAFLGSPKSAPTLHVT